MPETCDVCGRAIEGPATYTFDEAGEIEKVTHQTRQCERGEPRARRASAEKPRRGGSALDVGRLLGGKGE